MEGSAVAVCEILKYLIIHWKCETAGTSKGALLEGQLVISMEALNSKHQENTLHCVTTIASAGSIYGGLVLKKFLKEIQSLLPGFSAKLNWTSEEASYSQDISGVTPFQMIFEVDEKPRTLMTDSLVIKNFLHKIVMVHPKIKFNFSVKVNGVLSVEVFGTKNEPTLNLSNGIALVISCRHYVSKPKFATAELLCSRIHPVLGHPVMLFIPDDMVGMGLLGELTLTPAAALCPCPEVFPNQLNRISSVSIFLYGPSGLPLILPGQEQPTTTVFKDTSYFIDWKKYHLCMVPSLDLNLDRGVHTLLTTHLSAILMESHSAVQDSIQVAMDQALEQHHQATKAVDTQEFGTKLHKSFHDITRHRSLPYCSCETKQQLLPEENAEENTEDVQENSLELLAGTSGQVENKRLQQGLEETRAFLSARGPSQSEAAACRTKPTAASLTPSGSRASPGGDLEDSLWQREVSNLSEWLNPGPEP
ncbi:type 2 DNA topoisomerase 6 subunit B-like isoform X8 [Mustela putorius furo]|uniref:Type 2 DNA topoisomerase 6 subunit B-like isoform X8 n=1 Tax=Mustela putorius furo TaxID=9669 RepID=A0A8U0UPA6_MUSPF|nr:type 2 DNA topoisomerase 6 subunit B-like isoform X8 [Mustela putorius furo]